MEEPLISGRERKISVTRTLSTPIAEVYTRARRRIQSLSENMQSTSTEFFSGSRKNQYLAALAANMGALALGSVLSWSAVALPDLRKETELETMTDADESWISSIVTLAAVASAPVAGFGLERFGRRFSMLVLTIPFFIGWILIYMASNLPMIIAGRFITGFCGGTFAVTAPIFTAEIADPKIRGLLGAGFDMAITVGQLFIFALGAFISWRTYTLICAMVPVVIFLLMIFVPESPTFLLESKKDESKAVAALMRLRGASSSRQIENELNDLKQSNAKMKELSNGSWRELFRLSVLRPVSISMMLFTFQVISGIDPVLFFTVDIFEAAGSTIDSYYATIVVGAVQVVAATAGALLVDESGRKLLLLLSEAFMAISLSTLSLFFYLKNENNGVNPDGLGFLPLTSLIVFVVAYSFGLGPIAYLLLGELVPPHIKGLASCLLTCVKWLISFLLIKFFSDILNNLGKDGGFLLFAGFCAIGFFYILFFVPETKGKTLDEIQQGFQDRPFSNSAVSETLTPLREDSDNSSKRSYNAIL